MDTSLLVRRTLRNSLILTIFLLVNVTGQNEDSCNGITCVAPDCYCPTARIPKDLDRDNIPQLVIISFNGPMTLKHRTYLEKIFTRLRKNPNGTPIRMTLFISDDRKKSDYCSASKLWVAANEIASFSKTRKKPASYWADASEENWEKEIDGQKEVLVEEAMIKETDIKGFRSPYLQPGGNSQYKFAVDKGYTFDSSIIIPTTHDNASEPKIWPYTMNFPSDLGCFREPCPDERFPGLWQIPIQPLFDDSGKPCLYLDSCRSPPRSADEVFNILMRGFNQSYYNNRAPFMVNFLNYKEWFDSNGDWPIDGINRFIDHVLAYESDDVYFVTYSDLIGWMKEPTTLYTIRQFGPFTRIQNIGMECSERTDSRSPVNGTILVVAETVILTLTYLYLYYKDNQA